MYSCHALKQDYKLLCYKEERKAVPISRRMTQDSGNIFKSPFPYNYLFISAFEGGMVIVTEDGHPVLFLEPYVPNNIQLPSSFSHSQ